MFTDGFLAAAVLLGGLGLAGLLAGAQLAGVDVRSRLTPSTATARRGATLVVVGLLISTAVLSGIGGPVSPVETVEAGYFEGCQFSDSLTFAIGASLGLSDQDCTFYQPDSNTDELAQTDAYANALGLADQQNTFQDTSENFAQDARSVAWAKAKISIVNDLNNNVSEAQAKENAKQVVEDYYLTQEKNAMKSYSDTLVQLDYLDDANQSALYYVDPDGSGDNNWIELQARHATFNSSINSSVQVDGRYPAILESGGGIDGRTGWRTPYDATNKNTTGLWGGTASQPIAYARNVDGTEKQIWNASWYSARQNTLTQQYNQITANIDAYVNETYAAYQAGEIDSTDLAASDPTTIATQAATDYNSTGYYGLASAQLAALGLSGNETISHVVNTTKNGSVRQISGTVFYTGEDSQSFETGTEYDPTNLNGTVYMSVATIKNDNGSELNRSGGFYHVDEPFTIVEATNTRSGDPVNTTTMETRNYTTTNVSHLAEEIDRLKEQREFYEEQAASSGGVGLDFGGTGTGIIIALAAVAALFIFTRE